MHANRSGLDASFRSDPLVVFELLANVLNHCGLATLARACQVCHLWADATNQLTYASSHAFYEKTKAHAVQRLEFRLRAGGARRVGLSIPAMPLPSSGDHGAILRLLTQNSYRFTSVRIKTDNDDVDVIATALLQNGVPQLREIALIASLSREVRTSKHSIASIYASAASLRALALIGFEPRGGLDGSEEQLRDLSVIELLGRPSLSFGRWLTDPPARTLAVRDSRHHDAWICSFSLEPVSWASLFAFQEAALTGSPTLSNGGVDNSRGYRRGIVCGSVIRDGQMLTALTTCTILTALSVPATLWCQLVEGIDLPQLRLLHMLVHVRVSRNGVDQSPFMRPSDDCTVPVLTCPRLGLVAFQLFQPYNHAEVPQHPAIAAWRWAPVATYHRDEVAQFMHSYMGWKGTLRVGALGCDLAFDGIGTATAIQFVEIENEVEDFATLAAMMSPNLAG